jgi:hypothetical protein
VIGQKKVRGKLEGCAEYNDQGRKGRKAGKGSRNITQKTMTAISGFGSQHASHASVWITGFKQKLQPWEDQLIAFHQRVHASPHPPFTYYHVHPSHRDFNR